MKKNWIHTPVAAQQTRKLQQELGIPSVLCELLIARGISEPKEAQAFFNAGKEQLHHPFLLKDLEKAALRLQQAIERKERILLYGDYDVDGTTSIALLHSFLSPFTPHLDYYIPDRYKEGYGVSMAGIDYAQQNKIDLLITLDCGIKAVHPVRQANAYGIDVIICDHHLPGTELPDALAIIDPKRPDCTYPYQELCGAGVAFKLAQGYAMLAGLPEETTHKLLDLLVIAIACDIVPLTGENRAMARMGLQRFHQKARIGIRALIRESKRELPLTIADLVFGLGPMINAAGRLGDARQAVRLLLAEDIFVAADLARDLGRQNELRKDFDRQITEEAKALFVAQADAEQQASIVLYHPKWHKGVVGIVASRMVETFHRPCIILTESEGKIVGSARSVPGFDVHAALEQCEDLLQNYGGHRYAAGLTLAAEQLENFVERFETVVRACIEPESREVVIPIAGELALADIDRGFWEQLRRFAPFGPGNRNPVFVSRRVFDTGHSRLLQNDHLRLSIQQDDSSVMVGIAFEQGAAFEAIRDGAFDLCYTIQENHWKEQRTLQLNVRDVKITANGQF